MRIPNYFLLLSSLLFGLACTSNPSPVEVDLLIQHGTVFSGADASPEVLDIGIRGDTIAFIGKADEQSVHAQETIDATGFWVTPGFIDPHTHSYGDLRDSLRKSNLNYLMQGVTTVCIGNDGGGPLDTEAAISYLSEQGVGTNVAMFAGHGSIRGKVMGRAARAPTSAELATMQDYVRQAMEAGALGLSTGLYYAPGSFAETEEVIALSAIAAEYSGIYESHIRDESSYTVGLIGAVEEVLRIGREAKIPVHIAHIKALGVDVWDKSTEVIALIEAAQAEGIQVSADQYPYRASGTSIASALVPRWVMADSREAQQQRLQDPQLLPRIRLAIQENLRKRGGPESLLITRYSDSTLVNQHLGEIAEAWNIDPVEAAIQLTLAGDAGVASFNMQESDIHQFMRQPWVMTCSDGSSGHPRKYGTYPKKFQQYVLRDSVISPASFIHKSSQLVAQTFNIAKRGSLRTGYFADVILFNPEQFQANSTFQEPDLLATGMAHVFVNGQQVVREGAYTGVLAGKALKRGE